MSTIACVLESISIFTLSPSEDGEVTVSLPSGAVTDQDGNFNTASDTLSLVYDATAPQIGIYSNVSPLTRNSPVPINIVLSEPVKDFAQEDVDVNPGTITKFSDGFSYALSFDGVDDQVLGTASSSLDVSSTNKLTISAWVRPIANTQSGVDMIFAHTDNEVWYQYALGMDANNKLYFLSGTGNFESGGSNYSNTALTMGEWTYVVMTYDGSAVRLYINGALDFTHEVVDQFPDGYKGEFLIGNVYGSSPFQGDIDEVSIWDRALSSNEISNYFSSKPNTTEQGLVGYWNFDEGSGDLLSDQTSSGSDGAISGAYWTDGVLADFQGDNVSYLIEVDMASDAVISVSVDENVAQDNAGNGNEASSVYQITYNGVPPGTPTGLVSISGEQSITLGWDDVFASDLGGYNLYELPVENEISGFTFSGIFKFIILALFE